MYQLTANFSGVAQRKTWKGREYLVAPATLIVPGVLNGNKGPLYYSTKSLRANMKEWNGRPITLGHPIEDGQARMAKSVDAIGRVRNARVNGKLTAELWFDVEATRCADDRIVDLIQTGQRIELSTGLECCRKPAPEGSTHNGITYTHIADDVMPDHLAILPDGVGACSLADGCGVLNEISTEQLTLEGLEWLKENAMTQTKLRDLRTEKVDREDYLPIPVLNFAEEAEIKKPCTNCDDDLDDEDDDVLIPPRLTF